MIAIKKGYQYELANFEPNHEDNSPNSQVITFIEKEPVSEGSTELRTVQNGTTNEEVLAMLIDRMSFQHAKLPSRESAIVITKLEESLMWLNKRTAERKARSVEGTMAA
jgi:hypothetical protein